MSFLSSLTDWVRSAGGAGDSAELSVSRSPETVFRARAWQEHEKMGWPTPKTETWRYTSPASLLQAHLIWNTVSPELTLGEQGEIAHWRKSFDVLAFKNGRLLDSQPVPSGVTVQPWPKCGSELQAIDWNWEDGFAPAMAAGATGGALISVTQSPSRPLLLFHLRGGEGRCDSSVNSVSIASGCEASILEMCSGEGNGFSASQTFLNAQSDARLIYARVVRSDENGRHFLDMQMHLHRGARVQLTNVNLGVSWSRSRLSAVLSGEGAEVQMNGIAFGLGSQHNDQRVEVRHLAPHTQSRQLFKGIWRDRARGVVNGKIYIAPGAQKVDSAQLNHNLLLSKTAEADTKPELEVYADDVKANHGASIGRMDEEKLFYLLSRGISKSAAVQLLAEGFIQDIVVKCDSRLLRETLTDEIRKILPRYARELEEAGR